MARVAILFTQRLFLRNWNDTDVLRILALEHQLTLFTTKAELTDNEARDISFPELNLKLLKVEFGPLDRAILAIERRMSLSTLPTLRFRLKRHYFGDVIIGLSQIWATTGLRFLLIRITTVLSALRKSGFGTIVLATPKSISRLVLTNLLKKESKRGSWAAPVSELLDFDFVIIPTASQEPELFPILRELKRSRLEKAPESIMVMENWDNLTSKITFPVTPDFVTVMGRTQVLQASKIHGLQENQCVVAGLPKFQGYLRLEHKNNETRPQPSLSRGISVLYLGFSMPCKEHEVVNSLVEKVGASGRTTVWYRPHPARQQMPIAEPKLDDRVRTITFTDENVAAGGGLPALDYNYFTELTKYDLVVTPPTTMGLEYLLAGAKVVFDFRPDKTLRTSPGNLLNVYPHIRDLYDICRGLTFTNEEELHSLVDEFLNGTLLDVNPKEVIETLDFASTLSGFLNERLAIR